MPAQLVLPLKHLQEEVLNTIAKGLGASRTGKGNPLPTPLSEATPVKVDVSHIWPPDDPFTKAHAELTATLLGLQNKLPWPAYQAPWEKARAAILASYGMTIEAFYAELRVRVAAERASKARS